MAICSDLDETPSADAYFSIATFLNTHGNTPIGRGVGLEVGNTIYFNMPKDQFAYWNTDDISRTKIHRLIRSGHIDCLHSFGDLATTREDAKLSLMALERHGCRLSVWIDHAQARTNLGRDIMQGYGDLTDDPAYHADLTLGHGVRYVSMGRVTSLIGQGTRYRPLDIFDLKRPVSSGRSLLKDVAKYALAGRNDGKYRLHAQNRVMRETQLRDGQGIVEFMRCNPHPQGVSCGDNSIGMGEVLTDRYLSKLINCGGSAVIYTHLGKKLRPKDYFSTKTRTAFERLASYSGDGRILVTTTRRLLGFKEAASKVSGRIVDRRDQRCVELKVPDGCDESGITFYWDGELPKVLVNGTERQDIQVNPVDETGRASVGIRWNKLEWGL